ncbi:VCBS repeat-containing protein [candidate division KSB1 bacterium]|nr:VCBS repeat-containing protein [candidate division KSB1 bacterium]
MRRPATIALTLACGLMITLMGYGEALRAQDFVRTTISSDVLELYSAGTGDFDGDGDLDIAACGFSGTIFWLETLPDRTRQARQLNIGGGTFRHLAVADFNQDGRDDIALAAYGLNTTYILTATGLGGANAFTVRQVGDGQQGQFDVCVDDISGDGVPDLVVAAYLSNVIQMFVSVGDSLVLVDAVNITGSHPLDVATADIDHDGDRDVVVGTDWRGVYWVEQVNLTTWESHTLGTLGSTTWVTGGDVNADGFDDVIVSDYDGGRIVLWIGGSGGMTEQALSTSISYPRGTALADFDMNGTLDIVGVAADGAVYWWRNNGNLSFSYQTLTANYRNMGISIGDVDQDGDADFLVCENQQSQMQFYENRMGTPAQVMGTVRALGGGQFLDRIPVRILETGVTAFTSQTGEYSLLTAPGTYTLMTQHPCWTDTMVGGVVANADSAAVLNFLLRRPLIDVQVSSLNVIVHNRTTATAQIPVLNNGDGPLHVSATAQGNLVPDPWLSVSPADLTVLPGELQDFEVTISPDTSDSAIWDYIGQILLASNTCPDSDIVITVTAFVLDAETRGVVPREFGITSIYPNPFNPTAVVEFMLPRTGAATVRLYDVAGRLVRALADDVQTAGLHRIAVDGSDLTAGVYFVHLRADGQNSTRKVVLLK